MEENIYTYVTNMLGYYYQVNAKSSKTNCQKKKANDLVKNQARNINRVFSDKEINMLIMLINCKNIIQNSYEISSDLSLNEKYQLKTDNVCCQVSRE